MITYSITSMRYQTIILEGPANADLSALEDEWVESHAGTVIEFAKWLIDNKGFQTQKNQEYKFQRG